MEVSTTSPGAGEDVDTVTAATHNTTTRRTANRQSPIGGAAATPVGATAVETTTQKATRFTLAGLRLALGWVFLWAFLDKLFGLGFATPSANAWINGGSPTEGFLGNAVTGPFEGIYHGIAGAAWADWLFMLGLAAIGTALVVGVGVRLAAAAGGLLLVLMWTAVLPPENNPFMDDHLIYAGLLAVLALTAAGDTLGLGKAWAKLPIVRRQPWLK
jgi:thiosulfate dehydrogenase [quinone] large subunit